MAEESTRSRPDGAPPPAPAQGTEDPVSVAMAEGLMAAIAARFGDRLDETGRARVRHDVELLLANSATLSAYPLTNGDEPDFVFDPYSV